MDIKQQTKNVAAQGRYGDSMLLHVNPAEVKGLASAMPITTNPETGQPEAFLPFLAPILGSMLAPTILAGTGLSAAAMSGIGAGLATYAQTGGSGSKALLSGLTAGMGTKALNTGAEAAIGADAAIQPGIDAAVLPGATDLSVQTAQQTARDTAIKAAQEGSKLGFNPAGDFRGFTPGEALSNTFSGGFDQGAQALATGMMSPSGMVAGASLGAQGIIQSQEEYERMLIQMGLDEEERKKRMYERYPEQIPMAEGGRTGFRRGGFNMYGGRGRGGGGGQYNQTGTGYNYGAYNAPRARRVNPIPAGFMPGFMPEFSYFQGMNPTATDIQGSNPYATPSAYMGRERRGGLGGMFGDRRGYSPQLTPPPPQFGGYGNPFMQTPSYRSFYGNPQMGGMINPYARFTQQPIQPYYGYQPPQPPPPDDTPPPDVPPPDVPPPDKTPPPGDTPPPQEGKPPIIYAGDPSQPNPVETPPAYQAPGMGNFKGNPIQYPGGSENFNYKGETFVPPDKTPPPQEGKPPVVPAPPSAPSPTPTPSPITIPIEGGSDVTIPGFTMPGFGGKPIGGGVTNPISGGSDFLPKPPQIGGPVNDGPGRPTQIGTRDAGLQVIPPIPGGPAEGITSINQILNPLDPNNRATIGPDGKPVPKPAEIDYGFGPGIRPGAPVNDGPGSMGRPVAPILGGSDFLPKPPDLTSPTQKIGVPAPIQLVDNQQGMPEPILQSIPNDPLAQSSFQPSDPIVSGGFMSQPNTREALGRVDTRDYASMSDDEIKKLIPQISYGTPGNEKTADIGQARIDEFRLEKTDPQLFSQLMKDLSSGNALPENYTNPIAKQMAERDQASRAKFAEFQRNNPVIPPVAPPPPDGTPENPFAMQPVKTPFVPVTTPPAESVTTPQSGIKQPMPMPAQGGRLPAPQVGGGFMSQPNTDFQTSLPVNSTGFIPPSPLVETGNNNQMNNPFSQASFTPPVATNQKGLASIGTQQKNMFAAPMFAGGGETELPNEGLKALAQTEKGKKAVEAMGYQEGGQTDMMQDPITQEAIMFILGESEDENIINMFVEKYGNEAFMQLRDMILKQAAGNPNAQTEGLIQGQGNSGMADDLPGVIGNKEKIAVSQDEFIVPADVVSMLGDGSSDAGSKQLYNMMDRVRKAKTGGTTQAPPIDPNKVMPA